MKNTTDLLRLAFAAPKKTAAHHFLAGIIVAVSLFGPFPRLLQGLSIPAQAARWLVLAVLAAALLWTACTGRVAGRPGRCWYSVGLLAAGLVMAVLPGDYDGVFAALAGALLLAADLALLWKETRRP